MIELCTDKFKLDYICNKKHQTIVKHTTDIKQVCQGVHLLIKGLTQLYLSIDVIGAAIFFFQSSAVDFISISFFTQLLPTAPDDLEGEATVPFFCFSALQLLKAVTFCVSELMQYQLAEGPLHLDDIQFLAYHIIVNQVRAKVSHETFTFLTESRLKHRLIIQYSGAVLTWQLHFSITPYTLSSPLGLFLSSRVTDCEVLRIVVRSLS